LCTADKCGLIIFVRQASSVYADHRPRDGTSAAGSVVEEVRFVQNPPNAVFQRFAAQAYALTYVATYGVRDTISYV
jgi:hypothetical protein